ncbi:MAG: SDR family oxidoreductase [Neomegalonema sp.]|nr:SDR family oxidoreductase [Neomegalonema sp.]
MPSDTPSSLLRALDLTGRRFVVTGAGGHLGRAISLELGALGADVLALERSEDGLVPLRTAFETFGGTLTCLRCDLGVESELRAAMARILEEAPVLDGLVHNAAFVGTAAAQGWASSWESQSAELWREALEVNLTAPFILTQGLTGALSASGRGSVVMVGSIYGLTGPDWRLYEGTDLGNPAAYAASKGGLMQMTRWLASTLAPKVRVNAFCPGGIERGQDPAFVERYVARTPMGRMASEADMVGTALYLLSDMSRYVTGQVIAVDGGWTAW